jgi:hypothetical protein
VRILEEGHALRQEAYQRERVALQALAEERERRHKAELLALEAQMQAKLEVLTRPRKVPATCRDGTGMGYYRDFHMAEDFIEPEPEEELFFEFGDEEIRSLPQEVLEGD